MERVDIIYGMKKRSNTLYTIYNTNTVYNDTEIMPFLGLKTRKLIFMKIKSLYSFNNFKRVIKSEKIIGIKRVRLINVAVFFYSLILIY